MRTRVYTARSRTPTDEDDDDDDEEEEAQRIHEKPVGMLLPHTALQLNPATPATLPRCSHRMCKSFVSPVTVDIGLQKLLD